MGSRTTHHIDGPCMTPLKEAKCLSKGENENRTFPVFSKAEQIARSFRHHTELLVIRTLRLSLLLVGTDKDLEIRAALCDVHQRDVQSLSMSDSWQEFKGATSGKGQEAESACNR